jgi:EAL domain-containing protein (putative c-di-GMP-specific phosphodiesterase class I)
LAQGQNYVIVGCGVPTCTRAFVDLAHNLGMEGVSVEIEEQETRLREMGCDFAQGFYLAKPLPAEVVPGFLSV